MKIICQIEHNNTNKLSLFYIYIDFSFRQSIYLLDVYCVNDFDGVFSSYIYIYISNGSMANRNTHYTQMDRTVFQDSTRNDLC